MNDDLVEIYRPLSSQHARLLQNLLEVHDIEAFVSGEEVQGALGIQGYAWEGTPRVYVASHDADAAREVAAQFEESLKKSHDDNKDDDDFDEEPEESWTDWPTCPTCSTKRTAACPSCETMGQDFSLAEFVVDAEGPLLVCPNCDEYFPPRFCRTCDDCGHDYGTGVEIVIYDTDVINHRAVFLTIAICLFGLAAIAYFISMLSK